METDREVSGGDARLRRAFVWPAWRWLPSWLRGLALLIMRPGFALRALGAIAKPYVTLPTVLVSPKRLEVHHDRGGARVAVPTAFEAKPLYGGGARVVATLDDESTLELPLGDLTVAEADALAISLSERVRPRDGSYR